MNNPDYSFECEMAPVTKETMDAFEKMLAVEGFTITVEKDGEYFPIATISRHPDCPVELYEKVIIDLIHKWPI